MILVAPSILSADHGRLAREIEAIEAAGADWLHIDIMDGHFVPNLTFGPWIVEMAKKTTKLPLDVHLMVTDPLAQGPTFARAGADYVSVHVEATPHPHRAFELIRQAGAKPGLALNPLTPLGALEPCLEYLDLIVLMGVNPGWAGQAFIPGVVDRARKAAALVAAQNSPRSPLIEVDGGVTGQTAAPLRAAGAQILVSGSFVFGAPDYGQAIAQLRGL